MNALWGRGSRGEGRSNALWGRGGRTGIAVAAVASLIASLVLAAGAYAGTGRGSVSVYVPDSLASAVQQNPRATFDVILLGDPKGRSHGLLQKILADTSGSSDEQVASANVQSEYNAVDGVHASLKGRQILKLVRRGLVSAILPNEPVQMTGVSLPAYNFQLWPWATGAPVDWVSNSPSTPTIAIVDSGIDASRSDFSGGRVIGQINLSSLTPTATGDGYGHGTFVAGIAADSAPGYAGVAPKAKLLSIRVMDNNGMTTVADVIHACDWILANKSTYNIKVVNLSLHAVNRASVLFDPLDQAVEKLWLNGVVVVAAAGNYAVNGQASGVQFAPGNDPFVITVGAADIGTHVGAGDDTVAPWSAWGYTPDGFMKPDIGAPGRYMIGPVSQGTVLTQERPDDVSSPGYMQLSGTSFAAPVVSAAAAMLLGQHPSWTPDQVKAVLMMTATNQPQVQSGQLGVGDVNVAKARMTNPSTFPNPNAGLEQYVTTATDGSNVFDSVAWQSAAQSNVAWNSVAWSSVAWSSAAWSSVAWSSVAWSSVAWSSVAWGSVAWSSVAWSDVAWSDVAWSDGSVNDVQPGADATAAPADEQDVTLADLGIVDPTCDPTIDTCIAPPDPADPPADGGTTP